MSNTDAKDNRVVYCICPRCNSPRRKIGKRWNIIKRGKERNGLARFFCRNCGVWFNEKTGQAMEWYER